MKAAIQSGPIKMLNDNVEKGDMKACLEATSCDACQDLYDAHKEFLELKMLPGNLRSAMVDFLSKPAFADYNKSQLDSMDEKNDNLFKKEAAANTNMLANLTIIQALNRPLGPGELRNTPVVRCREGLARKELTERHPTFAAALAAQCGAGPPPA